MRPSSCLPERDRRAGDAADLDDAIAPVADLAKELWVRTRQAGKVPMLRFLLSRRFVRVHDQSRFAACCQHQASQPAMRRSAEAGVPHL